MIETIIVIAMIGILTAIAAPNFSALFDSIKLDQTVTELRSALSEAQRQAIRDGQACITSVMVQNIADSGKVLNFQSVLHSQCADKANDINLPEGISVVSNIEFSAATTLGPGGTTPTAEDKKNSFLEWLAQKACKFGNPPWCSNNLGNETQVAVVDIGFGKLGNANYNVQTTQSIVPDPTGKFVVFVSKRAGGKQKCIAISPRLGLTRLGFYNGGLAPTEITDEGTCTPVAWDES